MSRLKDLLASNYTGNMSVGNTLIMQAANDPAADGLFMRVNGQGEVVGYRAVNQDLEHVETDERDILLPDSEEKIIEMTVPFAITSENGSYVFTCKLNNGSNNADDNVTFVLRDGSENAIASKMVTIDRGDTGYSVTFYGSFQNDWVENSTFKVYAYSNRDSKVMGSSLMPTGLKIVEARAAPLTAMATAQKELVFDNTVTEPTHADIIAALGSYINDKEIIDKNFTALAKNESETTFWQIFYDNNSDSFFIHEILKASK